jgi:hypothetical protein
LAFCPKKTKLKTKKKKKVGRKNKIFPILLYICYSHNAEQEMTDSAL